MASEGHAVERACRITGVSHAGYYTWRLRAPSERAIRHAWLLDQIIEVHAASRGTYGARRVHAELTLGRGVKVGHNAVEMLMSRAQIYGLPGPKRRKKVPRVVTATDLVDRDFARVEPDRLWVTDIERHEAFLNLAVVKGHRHASVAADVLKLRAA
jgi:putative transposase